MALELSNLHPAPGSTKARTRIGRGQGSGLGKTAGRGQKGQGSRTGVTISGGFEGGQMPLKRRLPKFGFRSPFPKDYSVVNVGKLAGLAAGSVVDLASLEEHGVISRSGSDGLKVLGDGDLGVALTVKAAKVSASAKAKIEAAGGSVEIIA